MTRRLELHPDAVAELRAARLWYRSHDRGIGRAFSEEYKHAITRITNDPERWPHFLHGTRRHRLRGFPYVIAYRVTTSAVLILAVAHERRKPGYWVGRT